MFQIGPSLREARTRRGLSPADVHKAVRIRERYLTALEEEHWDMLPGDAYTKGFLRTYAEFLGLDGQLCVDEYNSRAARSDEEPLVPESLRKTGRTSPILFRTIGAAVLVGAVVAGIVAWQQTGTGARPRIQSASAAPKTPVKHPARASARNAKTAVTPKPAFTVVRAARDRSWLSVRIGGPDGREIYRGTLEQGRVLKFGLAHGIWMRMGRPFALDIHLGARVVGDLPSAPANILLTRNGARR